MANGYLPVSPFFVPATFGRSVDTPVQFLFQKILSESDIRSGMVFPQVAAEELVQKCPEISGLTLETRPEDRYVMEVVMPGGIVDEIVIMKGPSDPNSLKVVGDVFWRSFVERFPLQAGDVLLCWASIVNVDNKVYGATYDAKGLGHAGAAPVDAQIISGNQEEV